MNQMKRIAVLCGGDSAERDVSLDSGAQVVQSLNHAGCEATLVDLLYSADAVKASSADVDGFFIALHGGWGENGQLQALLELQQRPFAGSDSRCCALAMNKWVSKALFDRAGVRTPQGAVVSENRFDGDLSGLHRALERYERLVVKPNNGGSTVATTVVKDHDSLYSALKLAWAQEDMALVEAFIPGRELTVGLWESDEGLQVLPITEILPDSGFYDYEAKYTDGVTTFMTPAELPDDVTERVKTSALKGWHSLGCRDYARFDFRLNVDGDVYILEANTVPGLTSHSLLPQSLEAIDLDFGAFLFQLMQRAARRHNR